MQSFIQRLRNVWSPQRYSSLLYLGFRVADDSETQYDCHSDGKQGRRSKHYDSTEDNCQGSKQNVDISQ